MKKQAKLDSQSCYNFKEKKSKIKCNNKLNEY